LLKRFDLEVQTRSIPFRWNPELGVLYTCRGIELDGGRETKRSLAVVQNCRLFGALTHGGVTGGGGVGSKFPTVKAKQEYQFEVVFTFIIQGLFDFEHPRSGTVKLLEKLPTEEAANDRLVVDWVELKDTCAVTVPDPSPAITCQRIGKFWPAVRFRIGVSPATKFAPPHVAVFEGFVLNGAGYFKTA
jgi:hypothetical protein